MSTLRELVATHVDTAVSAALKPSSDNLTALEASRVALESALAAERGAGRVVTPDAVRCAVDPHDRRPWEHLSSLEQQRWHGAAVRLKMRTPTPEASRGE